MEAVPFPCYWWHGHNKPNIRERPPCTAFPLCSKQRLLRSRSRVPRKSRVKVDMITRITLEAAGESSQHPWDPHKPSFSHVLPKFVRPYPSFEGWFLRIADFANGVSVGVIMATNYATAQSQVTLLFALSSSKGSSFQPGRTYSVYGRSKESKFTQFPSPKGGEKEASPNEPKGFEWESPKLGHIVAHSHETYMDVTLEGYRFKSHMVNEVLWDAHNSEKGPEGWARKVPILPTHWYVYSLGSEATYELSNEGKGLSIEGRGLAHQEKNWGETFPAGHVWLQAFSYDNKCQVVASGAYFKIGGTVKTPYIFAMGYRSPDLNLDMRTNDPGVVFKDIKILPLEGKFLVKAVGPSHTLQIKCSAPPDSFSDPLLCPIGKLSWQPACRESYCAKLEIDAFEHAVWGVMGDSKLVERRVFDCAGLEFGEDLLREAQN